MKAKVIFSIVVVAVLSAGNNTSANNTQENDFHRIRLGVTFSPAYSYRTLKGSDIHGMLNSRNDYEIAKFGYSGGLNIDYNLKSWFGIESGILYTNKGYRTKKTYLSYDDPVIGNSQWIRTTYSYHYIDIPLKIRFSAGWEKIRFSAAAGITTGFLAGQTNTLQFENGRDKSPNYASDYNRVNLFPTISAGMDYKVTSKSTLRLEPVFQYGLVKTSKSEGPISDYLWSVGVNVSYLIGIK